MKKYLLSLCLALTAFALAADAQVFTSETTRKAGEALARGDRAGAIAVLDRAIEKRKDLLEAYQMRANLRLMNGDLDGAVGDFTAALDLSPNDARLYERRAAVRTLARDHAGALKDFDSAIANGSKAERVFTGRAAIKRDMGDIEGALADYQTALTINPYLAVAENQLVSILERNKNDPDGALAHLRQFLESYEQKRGGKLPSVGDESPAEATVLLKPDDKQKSVSQVSMTPSLIRANSPEDADKQGQRYEQLLNLAVAYANLGRMYAKKDDFERALESYEKGLKVRQDDPYLHKLRAELRIKKGDLRGAIEDLTVAVERDAGSPDLHMQKGLLLTLQGKDAEAEKEFDAHLQMFPQARQYLSARLDEAKKLRAEPPQR